MNTDEKILRMQQLVRELNEASEAYYNGLGERMTDYEWDARFDELRLLEQETGTTLPDSPTQKVSEDSIAGQKEEHEFAVNAHENVLVTGVPLYHSPAEISAGHQTYTPQHGTEGSPLTSL